MCPLPTGIRAKREFGIRIVLVVDLRQYHGLPPHNAEPTMNEETKFAIHPAARVAIDDAAKAAFDSLRDDRGAAPISGVPFKSERPKIVLGQDEIVIRETTLSGMTTVLAFTVGPARYAWRGSDYDRVRGVIDRLLKLPWAKQSIGTRFAEEVLIDWCRQQHRDLSTHQAFCEMLVAECTKQVTTQMLWVPVYDLEVQQGFSFGSVRFEPITKALLDQYETLLSRNASAVDLPRIAQFVAKARKDIQGLAAVALQVEADPYYAVDRAVEIGEAAVGCLRFFSPASYTPWEICTCAVLGSEYVPGSTVLKLNDQGVPCAVTKRTLPNAPAWQLTSAELTRFGAEGFDAAGSLVMDEKLNQFQKSVRSALLAHSKGTTLPDLSDRLVYTCSALDSLLLKDQSEPIQQNVGERMAFLVATSPDERKEVVRKGAASLRPTL
jgi:hypothetical protein